MKNKKPRLLFLTAVLLTLALIPGMIFAGWQQGDTGSAEFTKILIGKDKKEYYINEKAPTLFYKANGKKVTKAGHNRTKVRWRYFKFTNATKKESKYGYCVEFGADFSKSGRYKAKTSSKDTNFYQKMPQDVQQILALVLCYGRNGSNKVPVTGANDADYYFATQVLVWEAQQELRRIKTDSKGNPTGTVLAAAHGMKATHMQNFIKNRTAKKCYDWMLKKIHDHLKVHSFAAAKKGQAPVHTMKKQSDGSWSITLTDKNKKENKIILSSSKITVKKSGYNYTFTSKEPIPTALCLESKNGMTGGTSSKQMLIWHSITNTDYQAIIVGSDDLSVEFLKFITLQDTPTPAEVSIVKKDKETNQIIAKANTTYQLNDEASRDIIEKSILTNADGIALVKTKLEPGSYLLYEKQAPFGYVLDKTPLRFTINTGDSQLKLEQKDLPQKGTIRIRKTGESLQTKNNEISFKKKPLQGILFEISAAADIETGDGTLRVKKGEVVDVITTNQKGEAISKSLYLGTYNITEKESPDGYLMLSKPKSVVLSYKGQNISLINTDLDILNQLEKGKAVIKKTDVSTGKPLPNTGIEILDQNKKTLIQTRTDKNGNATFDKLPAGSYYFREFNAPAGYQIDTKPYPFEIKDNGEIVKCTMTNKLLDQSTPPTGDTFPWWLYIGILLAAAIVLVVIGLLRRD